MLFAVHVPQNTMPFFMVYRRRTCGEGVAEQLQQKMLDNKAEILTVIAESRMETLAFIIASVVSLSDEQQKRYAISKILLI